MAMKLSQSMRSEPLMRVDSGFGLNRYHSVFRVKSKRYKDGKSKGLIEQFEKLILRGKRL